MAIMTNDLSFDLCSLNFEKYSKAPHVMPMFRDLVSASHCSRNYKYLSALKKEIKNAGDSAAGRVLYPSGFVFHESRVGSTLVANVLGSDPMNMIFSESQPPADAFLRCSGCSHERHVEVFRDTILMMGRSPVHKRLFFKFQSITSTKMQIALEVCIEARLVMVIPFTLDIYMNDGYVRCMCMCQAFPDVPWIFLYRLPVQTMMSHMKGGSPPCLRSKRSPPQKVLLLAHKFSQKVMSVRQVKNGLVAGGVSASTAPMEAW